MIQRQRIAKDRIQVRNYRSIAFYSNDTEKKIIEDYVAELTRDQAFDKTNCYRNQAAYHIL